VSAVIVVVVIVVVVVMIVMVVIVDGTYVVVWVTISAVSAVAKVAKWVDKNTIVFEDTDDGIKHCVKVPQDEGHRRDTRYPNLDRLAEEYF
jgi:hypothetical protein